MAPPPLSVPVTIRGRRIETADRPGDQARAPIVMLHEGLGSAALWRGLPAELSEATGRRVLAFSRFGHGRSQTSPWPRSVTGFHHREALAMLPELLATLELTQPLLVGHSDGASIALIHAGRHPVSGLVLLAPHVFVESTTIAAIRETREGYLHGELRERMAKHHDDVDAAFWGWCGMWLDPEFEVWNLEGEAAVVDAPTLLIQGEEDPYGTLEQIERIEARLRGPAARLALGGGGHSPHFDAPEEVVRAVTRFAVGLP